MASVSIRGDILQEAAELIAGAADREAEAFRLGRLAGFCDGWESGLAAGLERAAA